MVQEELGKGALEQDAFVYGFAYEHAEESEVLREVRNQSRHWVRVQGALLFRLEEEGVLWVKDLLSDQGHEFLEEPTSVDAGLLFTSSVNELNPENTLRVLVSSDNGMVGVLYHVLSAHLDVATHMEVVVLVLLDGGHHMLEYLGSDLESIDLRTVLQKRVAYKF